MGTKEKIAYYNFDKVYSFNAVYNFIMGARGLGKTYGAKYKVIKRALTKGEQFIYLRRYKTEMGARTSFFADIAHEFPGWEFRVHGSVAQFRREGDKDPKKNPWFTMGYFIPLSMAQAQKSKAFPLVTTIIFDEFIIEKGNLRYLPDEAKLFNDFYSTVDRYKDKTKVFFLANSVSIMNPYFIEYDIKPDEVGEFEVKYDGFMLFHFADSEEFSGSVYRTRFGKFIKGTEYADYAVASQFKDENDNLVDIKSPEARYLFTLETEQGTFSVWRETRDEVKFFLQEKRPKAELIMTTMPGRMNGDKVLLLHSDKLMQTLRTAFKQGRTYFDGSRTRNAFIEIYRR